MSAALALLALGNVPAAGVFVLLGAQELDGLGRDLLAFSATGFVNRQRGGGERAEGERGCQCGAGEG